MSEIYQPDKEQRAGNPYPNIVDIRESPDRESMLYSYQNTVENSYSGDFRIYARKFGDYLRTSKSQVYDPAKNVFTDIPIKYAAPQYAFSDNLTAGSTGNSPEASLTDRLALPLISFYLADSKRDETRAVDPCVRARYRPQIQGKKFPEYNRAIVTSSPMPMDYQFQVDIWTEYREHYFQLLTAFQNDFNPISYLYDVYDMTDNTQRLQYTPYVPMFLDSVTDNSNFVPGTDRRVVRGTLRITVKGWLTPVLNNKPYVHETTIGINAEEVVAHNKTIVNGSGTNIMSNVSDTIEADVDSFIGRTGSVTSETGDYTAEQIVLTDTTLGGTVESALYALANDSNIITTIVLAEVMSANTCYKLAGGRAYIVRSTDMTLPSVDGITLESGGVGATVKAGKQIGGTYISATTFATSGPLYLGKQGQLTSFVPTFDLGDNYLMFVARSLGSTNQFVFTPGMIVRLN